MFAPASPVTGSPHTSYLTSPTYTLTADSAPDVNGTAYVVSALGGTQAGVLSHSASNPFTLLFTKPKTLKVLGPVNANGILGSVPRNVFALASKKGVTPLSGQPIAVALAKFEYSAPAGVDLADKPNLVAHLSMIAGVLWESANDIADSIIAGSR